IADHSTFAPKRTMSPASLSGIAETSRARRTNPPARAVGMLTIAPPGLLPCRGYNGGTLALVRLRGGSPLNAVRTDPHLGSRLLQTVAPAAGDKARNR